MTDQTDGPDARQHAVLVAESFVALADTLVDDYDVVELLDRLVSDCVRLLGVSAAGILLMNEDRVFEVVASSNEASRLMEVYEFESHTGPCVEAVETGEPVSITDVAELRRRWPAFSRAVQDVGFAGVHAVPMRLRDETIGALNLFTPMGVGLSDFDSRLARAMAEIATIAILQQRALTRSFDLAEDLQLALNTRVSVEQAKGMLAEFGGVDMGAAFEALRTFSREQRLKLSDVSQALIRRDLEPGRVIAARQIA